MCCAAAAAAPASRRLSFTAAFRFLFLDLDRLLTPPPSTRLQGPNAMSSSQSSSAAGREVERSSAGREVERSSKASECTAAGLQTWKDPTPRQSAFNSADLRDAFIAACKRMPRLPKLPSCEEIIRRGEQHDRQSLQIALNAYAKKNNMQSTELEFLEVKERNLIDESGKGYMHFNFLVKGLDGIISLFFAEIHPDCKEDDDVYLCCPLEDKDYGHCFGCQKQSLGLRHPASGDYLGGHEDVCFPFMVLESEEEECEYCSKCEYCGAV